MNADVSEPDAAAADELLDVGGRRLPRHVRRVLAGFLAAGGLAVAVVLAARPDVQAGHGTVAAATMQRYHAEHAVSGTPRGNPIRGYFLM